MKALSKLTPDESLNVKTSFELDFNCRVLNQRLVDIINCNSPDFKSQVTHSIDCFLDELDHLYNNFFKDENETKVNCCEDA